MLPFLRGLLGELITFAESEILIRDPRSKTQDIKAWHRDATRDFGRRMEIEYVSLVYYLTDVTENDHCLSIIPGSHYRLVDLKPADVTAGTEFDVTGPAGTAVLFHGRCIHAGKLKPNSRQRRCTFTSREAISRDIPSGPRFRGAFTRRTIRHCRRCFT